MTKNPPLTAIILAGQRPGTDPLAAAFSEEYKALIPLYGKPMFLHVFQTLSNVQEVSGVQILTQDKAAFSKLGDFDIGPSGDSIASTLIPLIKSATGPLLITTADHALLSPEMVSHFLDGAKDHDLAIGLVERKTLISAYPDSKRTWLKFRGGQYSGANLFWVHGKGMLPILEIWRDVEQKRKKGRALIGAFGPLILLGVALRLLTLKAALARVGKRFGISIMPVILPQAEACIDVDSVTDHDQVEQILAKREASTAP